MDAVEIDDERLIVRLWRRQQTEQRLATPIAA